MAQWTDNPIVDKCKPRSIDARIGWVVTSKEHTAMDICKKGRTFSTNTYLEYSDPTSGVTKTLKVTKAEANRGDYAMRLAGYGYCSYLLYFPPLPNGTTMFNLVEPNCMTLTGVHIFSVEYELDDNKSSEQSTITNDTGALSAPWSGSGFAIGQGFIVTNNHVVDEAKTIMIKGVEGNMNNGFSAEVIATDKVNDLAIIRINDSKFNNFSAMPYAVHQRMADFGEDVFVLGYPLTQALGNEIKLTNGIISSRTGYQGNVATYQMSAPVQPGNSGGPMFDNKGNVIGIVVAGVPGAENVGYAIKTSYLKILIESAGLNIQFPANNTISTMSLAEKVKRVKNFVFYIECSK